MKNKLTSLSITAIERRKYSKLSDGWKVIKPLSNNRSTWSITLEKKEGFTKAETYNYINRNMKLAKKKEKSKVAITAIILFILLLSVFIFSLIKLGAI